MEDKDNKKIGIDNLSREDREKLFKEFVRSGGKVLNERELQRQKIREQLAKQKDLMKQKREVSHNLLQKPVSNKVETRQESYKYDPSVYKKIKHEDFSVSFLDKLKVALNAYFSGCIKLSGYIKHRLFEEITKKTPEYFNDLRVIGYFLTNKDVSISNEVKKTLNALNPYAYEIVYRFNEFTNNDIFLKLERVYKIFAQTRETTKPHEIKELLKYIFKKLYVAYPFKDQTKVFVLSALRACSKYASKADLSRMEKLFLEAWAFLFSDYFFKLKTLIDFILGKELSFNSEYLIKFLELKEEDYIGFLTEKGISKIEEIKKEEKPLQEDKKDNQEKISISEEGVKLIAQIDLSKIQDSLKKEFYIDSNDKVFILESIIEFYESNVFPVLVSKAKYSNLRSADSSIDLKKSFDDIYTNVRKIRDKILEYYKLVQDYKTIDSDVMIPITRKSSLLNSRSMEMVRVSYQIRKEAIDVFGRIKNLLELIIADYNSGGDVLMNPSEVIEFKNIPLKNVEVEKNYFEGKTVIDAINEIFKFISGLIFLLTDADLGGSNVKLEKPIYLKNIL
ncbi:MAG: hypothetical protein ACP5PT_03975 [Brevinematia bacterium]